MSGSVQAGPTYSFVIPVYNEEETLSQLHAALTDILSRMDGECEVVFVDDGSSDGSCSVMEGICRRDGRFRLVGLSRNFGHQIAVTAGLDYATGRAVIIMDADLQDPPEAVLEMAKRWREGFDVVYGVREKREGETWFKRLTASTFYRILNVLANIQIPQDAGDFRLADRKAIEAIRGMHETSRFLRGMFAWIGFRQTAVKYRRAPRSAGTTKYPLRRMIRLAVDGVLSFSNLPLRIALVIGSLVAALSVGYGVVAVMLKLTGMYTVSGWTSLIVVVSFLGGIQLTVLGVMGEYVARMYDELRGRPLYLVSRTRGFEPGAAGQPDDHTRRPRP